MTLNDLHGMYAVTELVFHLYCICMLRMLIR
ncbi:hypothetical protein ALP53_200035 [Pseudomonas savastanoi pv. phaseolicola]|nr:hypothetical protein ALP53_200035 [Pseudomonas savastanoi pv. phaseolicola]